MHDAKDRRGTVDEVVQRRKREGAWPPSSTRAAAFASVECVRVAADIGSHRVNHADAVGNERAGDVTALHLRVENLRRGDLAALVQSLETDGVGADLGLPARVALLEVLPGLLMLGLVQPGGNSNRLGLVDDDEVGAAEVTTASAGDGEVVLGGVGCAGELGPGHVGVNGVDDGRTVAGRELRESFYRQPTLGGSHTGTEELADAIVHEPTIALAAAPGAAT